MKGDDIADRLIDFAVRVVRLGESLPKSTVGKHVAGQLVRSATSAGANYEEARGAESRSDFIHKVAVAWKEVRESWYWIRLIHRAALINPDLLNDILKETTELSAILAASLKTARSRETQSV